MSAHSPPEGTPNVHAEVYDTDVLRYLFPEWDALSKKQKLAYLRAEMASPASESHDSNVTCVGLHEYLPAVLNPEVDPDPVGVSHLAVGNDDTTAPAAANTQLNNEVGRPRTTDALHSGKSVDFEVFIDSGELNGYTLSELGLYTGPTTDTNALLLNHSLVSPTIDKTNSKTVIFTVTLSFSA